MQIKEGVIMGLGEVGSSWFKVLSENNYFDVTGIGLKGNREKRLHEKVSRKIIRLHHLNIFRCCGRKRAP